MPEQWRSAAFDLGEMNIASISHFVAYLLKAVYPFRQPGFHNPEVMIILFVNASEESYLRQVCDELVNIGLPCSGYHFFHRNIPSVVPIGNILCQTPRGRIDKIVGSDRSSWL